jgi:hypothetical protein
MSVIKKAQLRDRYAVVYNAYNQALKAKQAEDGRKVGVSLTFVCLNHHQRRTGTLSKFFNENPNEIVYPGEFDVDVTRK